MNIDSRRGLRRDTYTLVLAGGRGSRPRQLTDHVIVLAGDPVHKRDCSVMLAEHVDCGADRSVACLEVPLEDACDLGVMVVDTRQRVVALDERPAHPRPVPGKPGRALASMGIYTFNTPFLLERDAANAESSHDFGRDLVPGVLGQAR